MRFPILATLVTSLVLTTLVGCNLPDVPLDQLATAAPAYTAIPQYATVAAILTQTARVASSTPLAPTGMSSPTSADRTDSAPPTPAITIAHTATPQPSPTRMCDLAAAGLPIDVTIPDDSKMQPGETFVKVWRLVNAGECTWSRNYAANWFSGDKLGVQQEVAFNSEIPPGNSVDLSIDMVAPEKPGTYQSNWKLRNGQGELFGIGPGGGAPFWVRIQVVAIETVTPTVALPTQTSTPVISAAGNVTLAKGEGVDVDTGQIGADDQVDFYFVSDATQVVLSPANNAKATFFGANAPSLSECQAGELSEQPINLGSELEGAYLCIQTSRGLPGSIQISRYNPSETTLILAFTVWSVP